MDGGINDDGLACSRTASELHQDGWNVKYGPFEAGVLDERYSELNPTTPPTPSLSLSDTPDCEGLSDAPEGVGEAPTGYVILEEDATNTPSGGRDSITVEDLKGMEDNSLSRLEWIRQRSEEGATNKYIDELMTMVGLEDIKCHFLKMKSRVEVARRQEVRLSEERFNVAFVGNPGTGMSVIQPR